MTAENKKTEVKKEKEKLCPFDKDLACENCRLFVSYPDGRGEKTCIFNRII